MSISQEQLVEQLSNMTVMDLAKLRDTLEEKWGVSAAAPVAMAVAGAGAPGAVEEEVQTEFTVVLESFGAKKITVIKEVRAITGLGLKEAKALVEDVPSPVKEDINKEEAEELKTKLEGAGAVVTIK